MWEAGWSESQAGTDTRKMYKGGISTRKRPTFGIHLCRGNHCRGNGDPKGQGWYSWLRNGYIDAAVPMLYQVDKVEANLKTIRRAVGPDARIICGLNADGVTPESLMHQIAIARTSQCQGIAIWYSGAIADDLPLLSSGPFSNPANPPFRPLTK